jgi:hypothetical protein
MTEQAAGRNVERGMWRRRRIGREGESGRNEGLSERTGVEAEEGLRERI